MIISLEDWQAWAAAGVLGILGGYLTFATNGKVKSYGHLVLSGLFWPAGYILLGWRAPTWVDAMIAAIGALVVWTIPIFLVVAGLAKLAKSKRVTAWAAGFAFLPYLVFWFLFFRSGQASHWRDTWVIQRGEVTHAVAIGVAVGTAIATVFLFKQIGRARS